MTTLPQTTTLRLPRPTSSTQLSIPGAAAAPGLLAQPSGSQLSGGDVWRVIRAHLWLIIIMLIVSSGAGYMINQYLLKNYAKYTASGYIQLTAVGSVDPTKMFSQVGLDPNTLSMEKTTERTLLQSPALFNKVITFNNDVRASNWFQSFPTPQAAKQDLVDNLGVSLEADSKLMKISLSGRDPKSCQLVLEAIVDQHIQDQQKINQDRQYNRSIMFNNLKIRYQVKVSDLQSQINDKESSLNIDNIGSSSHRIMTKDQELSTLDESLLKAVLDANNAQDQLAGVNSMLNADQDPPQVDQIVNANPDVMRDRATLDQIQLDLKDSESNLLPENPHVKTLQSHKELYERRLADHIASARASGRVAVLEASKNQAVQTQRVVDAINKQIATVQADLADLSSQMNGYLSLKDEEAGYQAMLKQVKDQLERIQDSVTTANLAGVDWNTKPELPDVPSFPKLPLTMTISIAMGLMLSLGIAFLRELMDTTVRSPRDISRVGNMNLLGMVPHEADDPQSAGARLPLVIFEAPHSMMAEQLRQVRTRLQHSSSLDTTRSILITSPSPNDGKSTIACNLASGLALNGRRILLVDANFRRPELHRVFNLANDHGFSDVLNSLDLFEQAVQETQVPNLYVLPSGLKPTNATELLESQLLIDFVERALEEFDHVIFDSGPMLFVSETVALAPRVDGVITVVRARSNTRGVLQRMRDGLRQVKAEHLGVVLNAVRAQGGGYYGRNIRTYYEYQNGRAA